jgi:hypothetical protein
MLAEPKSQNRVGVIRNLQGMEQNYVELSRSELVKIEGGLWEIIVGGCVIAVFSKILDDWDNFKNGIAGRPEIKKV